MKNNETIKLLLRRAKNLSRQIENSLNDSHTQESARYTAYKIYIEQYEQLSKSAECVLMMPEGIRFGHYDVKKIKGQFDTVWPLQKELMESVKINIDDVILMLESETSFVDENYDNLASFIECNLRKVIHAKPSKEKEVQDAVENLFIGKGMDKGVDYDRESGKFEFSGKEYIPDFIVKNNDICIEVKLVKEGKQSRIIDEINADITAYSTRYERLLFIVYDLGDIRDVDEFKKDIEAAKENIKVLIIKH